MSDPSTQSLTFSVRLPTGVGEFMPVYQVMNSCSQGTDPTQLPQIQAGISRQT